jgi:hypothetical protein
VVEAVSNNGTVSIYSAIKAESTVTIADAIFDGGLIQQIDKVLTIPISPPATITGAGLSDLIALLTLQGMVRPHFYVGESHVRYFESTTILSASYVSGDILAKNSRYSVPSQEICTLSNIS